MHADFQPQLMKTDIVQLFSDRLCTLTYELAGYTEGVAKYPNCAGQFSVNFTVSPVADVSNMTTGSIAQYNVTNLGRCTVYNMFAQSYRGSQLMGTVYAADSVMISKLCIASYSTCIALQTNIPTGNRFLLHCMLCQ